MQRQEQVEPVGDVPGGAFERDRPSGGPESGDQLDGFFVILAIEAICIVLYFVAIALAGILIFVPVPAMIIIAQEFVPGAPATASGMVLGLGSALAGIAYIVLGRVQEAVGLTNGILIGFSMVVPAALIALVVLLRGRGEPPVAAATDS